MLSITGMNKFYYIKNFTDMRCKYNVSTQLLLCSYKN